jgi:hypothetical protein
MLSVNRFVQTQNIDTSNKIAVVVVVVEGTGATVIDKSGSHHKETQQHKTQP